MSTVSKPARAAQPNLKLIGALIAAVVIVIVAVVLVLILTHRSSNSLDLTGNWVAQDGPVTVDLTLHGSNAHLTGPITTKNSPIPLSGTVDAVVKGTLATVVVHAAGSVAHATCTVSNSKMVCAGKGGNQLLNLTFTRP